MGADGCLCVVGINARRAGEVGVSPGGVGREFGRAGGGFRFV